MARGIYLKLKKTGGSKYHEITSMRETVARFFGVVMGCYRNLRQVLRHLAIRFIDAPRVTVYRRSY